MGEAHDVVVAGSAVQALALIEDGRRFDIVLSDLMMPDMSGMDLHAPLMRCCPDQAGKMIFMTGGAFSPDAEAFLASVSNRALEKPFKPNALREVVRSRLAV